MSDRVAMSDGTRLWTLAISAAVVGGVLWVVLVAQGDSSAEEIDTLVFWVTLGLAVLFGAAAGDETNGALVGGALALPQVILSPWTAPRGDNDGLWVLIIPMMFIWLLVAAAVGSFAGWLVSRRSRPAQGSAHNP